MSWVRLDDDFASHRKVRRLSDSAFRLHVTALCWASKYLTDGHIAAEDIRYIGGDLNESMDPSALEATVKELVDHGVWHDDAHTCASCPTSTNGWIIHDFLDLNPSAEQTRQQRRDAAERQRRSRERRRDGAYMDDESGQPTGATEASRRDTPVTHTSVTRQSQRPVPYPSPTPSPKRKELSETPTSVPNTSKPKRQNDTEPDPTFDEFWATYPRREAKGAARKAWTKAVAKAGNARTLIDAAARYRDQPGREPQYTAHASTWLNQERWSDEPSANTRPARPNGFRPYLNPTSPDAYNGYHNINVGEAGDAA